MVRTRKIYCLFFCSVIVHGIYYFTTFLQTMLTCCMLHVACWHDMMHVDMLTWCIYVDMMHVDMLTWCIYVDMMQSMNGIVLLYNLLCFRQHMVYDLITKRSRQSCQNKGVVKDKKFLCFITINNISTAFFNWRIAAILFVSVIDYY